MRDDRAVAMRALVVAFLLLAMPLAQAGTFEDPEILDTPDDVKGPGGVPACTTGACTGPMGFADIDEVWIEQPDMDTLVFRMNSGNNANVYGSIAHVWFFQIGGEDFTAGMLVNQAQVSSGMSPTGAASAAEYRDSHPTVTVLLADIGSPAPGSVLTNFYATTTMRNNGVTLFTDRAPDAGFGRDYSLLAPPAPDVVHEFVTGDPASFSMAWDNATSAIWMVTWNTTLASIQLEHDVVVQSGTLNMTAVGPNGTAYDICLCAANSTATVALGPGGEGSNWTLVMDLQDFAGALTLSLAPLPVDEEEPVEPTTDAPQDDNETESNGSPTQKEAPIPIAIVLFSLVLALRRRD